MKASKKTKSKQLISKNSLKLKILTRKNKKDISNPKKESKKFRCRICGNNNKNKRYLINENMKGLNEVFTYFQCSKCGCLQIESFPLNISDYYFNNYYSYSENKFSNVNNFFVKIILNYILNYIIFNKGMLNKHLFNFLSLKYTTLLSLRAFSFIPNLTKNSKILDVGCGTGGKLYILKNFGFRNLLGIDPFLKKDFHYKNGLNILKNDIYDVKGKWDIIILNHSFEHMKNPIKTLKKIKKLLSNKGFCVIRMPTTSSYAWKHYKENWVQIDAPRHFFLHSLKSIKILAKKTGFRLEKYIYDSRSFQFWGSEQNLKKIPLLSKNSYMINRKKSIFSKNTIRLFNKRTKNLNEINQGDQASYYLIKIN